MATTTRVVDERREPRERWLADGIIAGFVAVGVSTAALFVAYLVANAAGTNDADIFRYWMWQLTHNQVVSFSQTAPAAALALHVVVGLVFAVIYARFADSWFPRDWAGWQRGVVFSLILWLLSGIVFLPVARAGFFGLDLRTSADPSERSRTQRSGGERSSAASASESRMRVVDRLGACTHALDLHMCHQERQVATP